MSSPDLDGRIALLTGAAGGIGQALSRAFVGAGMRVALCDTSREGLLRLQDELGVDRTLSLPMDVPDPASCRDSVDRTIARFGRLDVLVNNAALGMSTVRADHMCRVVQIEDITPELWARFMAVNLSGPFHMALAAVPGMRARRFERIINVTTSYFTMLNPGFSGRRVDGTQPVDSPGKDGAADAASRVRGRRRGHWHALRCREVGFLRCHRRYHRRIGGAGRLA